MRAPNIPYTILALAPFTAADKQAWQEQPLSFDRQEPDRAMARLRPACSILLPASLCPASGLELTFRRFRDLTPDGLVAGQPFLADLAAAADFLDTARRRGLEVPEIMAGLQKWPDLPPVALPETGAGKAPPGPTDAADPLDRILSMVAMPDRGTPPATGISATENPYRRILAEIMTLIFQDPGFRAMEAAWQGVRILAAQGGLHANVRLRLLPVIPATLEETLAALPDRLLDDPPALLLADCALDSSSRSLRLMEAIARCGHTLLVPALAWVTEKFFHIDSWQDLDRLAFLPHHLDGQEYAKWRRLQRSGAGRWLGLLCNRFLYRPPYGPDNPSRRVDFRENELPWIAPVWAAACLAGQGVAATGWPAGINDRRHRQLTDLALDQARHHPAPLETLFSDSRLEQLAGSGIMALATARGTDRAWIHGDVMIPADVRFSYQALVSRLARFMLWCRDRLDEEIGADGLAPAIRNSFRLFRERQGDTTGGELEVSVATGTADRQPVVRIQWSPPPALLRSGEKIVLELPW